ncbi:unnamed protein product, partial [Discosporangium mesarthrocarpum]
GDLTVSSSWESMSARRGRSRGGAVWTPLVVWTGEMCSCLESTLRQEADRVDGAAAAGRWPLWAVEDVRAAEGYKFQYPSLADIPVVCGLYIDLVATADRQTLTRSLEVVQVSPTTFLAVLDDAIASAQSAAKAAQRQKQGLEARGEETEGARAGSEGGREGTFYARPWCGVQPRGYSL